MIARLFTPLRLTTCLSVLSLSAAVHLQPCGGAIPLCMVQEFDLPMEIIDRKVGGRNAANSLPVPRMNSTAASQTHAVAKLAVLRTHPAAFQPAFCRAQSSCSLGDA